MFTIYLRVYTIYFRYVDISKTM